MLWEFERFNRWDLSTTVAQLRFECAILFDYDRGEGLGISSSKWITTVTIMNAVEAAIVTYNLYNRV